jgi:hypothetical protein
MDTARGVFNKFPLLPTLAANKSLYIVVLGFVLWALVGSTGLFVDHTGGSLSTPVRVLLTDLMATFFIVATILTYNGYKTNTSNIFSFLRSEKKDYLLLTLFLVVMFSLFPIQIGNLSSFSSKFGDFMNKFKHQTKSAFSALLPKKKQRFTMPNQKQHNYRSAFTSAGLDTDRSNTANFVIPP